ncbi:hypothetical protein WDV06_09720 [Streptomyces racemochromogenes]|uniref:Uncharacterized protein n=1 Tax=Streptomyces racemochromogenes TaxID=67353 RepID=A0ABW7PAI9_9ACTN
MSTSGPESPERRVAALEGGGGATDLVARGGLADGPGDGGADVREGLGDADGDADRDALAVADREGDGVALSVGPAGDCDGLPGAAPVTGTDGPGSASVVPSFPESVKSPSASATRPAATTAPAAASSGTARRRFGAGRPAGLL